MKEKLDRAFSEEQIRQWWKAIDEAARRAPTVTPAPPEPDPAGFKSSATKGAKTQLAKHGKP
ncbi:MAG: hypothetical protein AB1898_08625 [Acidobacteriota bacterium]